MADDTVDLPHVEPGRPLRIAALVKQVPLAEALELGPDGRLVREGLALELNPYCRRAVSKGVELAQLSGGTCTVFTLGPPSAEDVLREAVAWGADEGVHLCDAAFAGSDTLATARALAEALEREGPFDLVLVGRNTTDGDTGQVGPELAELLDLPFAVGVRTLGLVGDLAHLRLEHDDGWEDVELQIPALLAVAERLCEPCKVDPDGRAAVAPERIRRLSASELGPGPWGEAGSPTRVGNVRTLHHDRAAVVLSGPIEEQVAEAVRLLHERGALRRGHLEPDGVAALSEEAARSVASGLALRVQEPDGSPAVVSVVVEPGRETVAAELLGAASRLAAEVGGTVVALAPPGSGDAPEWGDLGADSVVTLKGAEPGVVLGADDVADALIEWARVHQPWAVLAPSTAFGREVAARMAAALGAGLVGDAIALDVVDGELVAAKPAFSGALVADITCTTPVRLVTMRPGVLDIPARRRHDAPSTELAVPARGRVVSVSMSRDDDVEVLARAQTVIGIGSGVHPDEFDRFGTLAAILGAELAATRKVTDKGWAPRSRQVGITGRSIAPRLYLAVGLSGKFNHMVGVRSAGTVLAVNTDPTAPVFGHADVGIVGDWHDVVPLLEEELRRALGTHDEAEVPDPVG